MPTADPTLARTKPAPDDHVSPPPAAAPAVLGPRGGGGGGAAEGCACEGRAGGGSWGAHYAWNAAGPRISRAPAPWRSSFAGRQRVVVTTPCRRALHVGRRN